MTALVLEEKKSITLRPFSIEEHLEPEDVRIQIHTVGICGSDIHYYQHGAIGPFVVREPMILGHEAAGTIIEIGSKVQQLKVGDRVCMEPGVPNPSSAVTRSGRYNLDPDVRFWATPPIHGCLRSTVVHPAAFTFRLPDNVSFAEGAMVEPLAVGLHAANKAQVKAGEIAVVLGAGPIGLLTAISALAAGCSHVIVTDVQAPKLAIAESLGPITSVDVSKEDLLKVVGSMTEGRGVDVVFECTGSKHVAATLFEVLAPGGRAVMIGMPGKPIPIDIVGAQIKEARIETVFRYAHVFPRALALMAAGKIDVRPLITDTFPFAESIQAFEFAAKMPPESIKVQITMPND